MRYAVRVLAILCILTVASCDQSASQPVPMPAANIDNGHPGIEGKYTLTGAVPENNLAYFAGADDWASGTIKGMVCMHVNGNLVFKHEFDGETRETLKMKEYDITNYLNQGTNSFMADFKLEPWKLSETLYEATKSDFEKGDGPVLWRLVVKRDGIPMKEWNVCVTAPEWKEGGGLEAKPSGTEMTMRLH
jgi:hypothetical protein